MAWGHECLNKCLFFQFQYVMLNATETTLKECVRKEIVKTAGALIALLL